MSLKALLGFHDNLCLDNTRLYVSLSGYSEIHEASSFDEMMRFVLSEEYDLYLMDTNLGSRGAVLIEPAQRVLRKLENLYPNQDFSFMSYTGNDDCYRLAKENNIPVELRQCGFDINFLMNSSKRKKLVIS